MSSSEDDYMSDSFLVGCVKEDIRPGLLHSHSDKRNHSILKKKQDKDEINKKKNPSSKFMELENRETALNQPISVENKGFAMLQKLGFKPGSGLGKSNAGRTEPVPINLKAGRQGLGHAEALKESVAKRKEIHNKLTNINDYRSHLAEKTAERRDLLDLKKSQRICKNLDTNEGVVEPDELWYWPDSDQNLPTSNYDDGGDDNEDEGEFEDEDGNDPLEAEPSQDKNEHGTEEESEEPIKIDDNFYTVKEKLEMLTHYLRTTHHYCIWCAVQFDDLHDLNKECPGPKHDDH